MSDIHKIKRVAAILIGIVSITLVLSFYFTTRTVLATIGLPDFNSGFIITITVGLLFQFATLVISLTLLFSIRKEESPFSPKCVTKLKALAILLIAFEPLSYALELVSQLFAPITIADQSAVPIEGIAYNFYVVGGESSGFVHTSYGGSLFVTGLAVYCIALILRYGISLQREVDETL